MVRRFFRDSAIYAFPALVSLATSLITFPLFAHYFAPRSYGILDLLSFASTLIVLVVALEIYQGVGRYVVGEKDFNLVRSYASTALWWTVGCYVAFCLITFPFARPITSAVLGPSVSPSLLRIAIAWTAVQGILTLMQTQLRWQMRSRPFVAASVINALLTTILALTFVFVAHLGIAGVLWAQLIGSSIVLPLVVFLARDIFKLSFDNDRLRKMLRFSMPLVISNIGVFLNLYADRLVIQHLRSVAAVGVYGVAGRIALLVTLALTGFQGAAAPLFLSYRDHASAPGEIAYIFRLFAALALALFLGLSIFATPLVRLVAASAYQPAARVVPFLVLSTLFANMYFFAPGLAIAERTGTMAKLTVVAGIANLALAIALVPPLGIVGAGIATALTSVGWFAALMWASQRQYPVPHQCRSLAQAAALAMFIVGICFATLPQSREEALSAGTLVLRAGATTGGAAACASLCLGAEEARNLSHRLVRTIRKSFPRVRQPA